MRLRSSNISFECWILWLSPRIVGPVTFWYLHEVSEGKFGQPGVKRTLDKHGGPTSQILADFGDRVAGRHTVRNVTIQLWHWMVFFGYCLNRTCEMIHPMGDVVHKLDLCIIPWGHLGGIPTVHLRAIRKYSLVGGWNRRRRCFVHKPCAICINELQHLDIVLLEPPRKLRDIACLHRRLSSGFLIGRMVPKGRVELP